MTHFRSGLVALIGRANVGKSTLLNRLVGEKISIVSRRPQTTRHRILGIKTAAGGQIAYVDTPGLDAPGVRRLNRYLTRLAGASVEGVDCVVLVVGARDARLDDAAGLGRIRGLRVPVILVINKVDQLKDKRALLPMMRAAAARMDFVEIIPLSARTGEGVDALERAVLSRLPQQPALFASDQITDKSARFQAQETVREQIYHLYGQEVPHVSAVEVTRFRLVKKRLDLEAIIWVEREGQKVILIGKGGARLKQVGIRVRRALERRHSATAKIRLWVKVRKGWSDDARALQRFGYHEEPI